MMTILMSFFFGGRGVGGVYFSGDGAGGFARRLECAYLFAG
jgi:hypothetical protein